MDTAVKENILPAYIQEVTYIVALEIFKLLIFVLKTIKFIVTTGYT